MFTSEERRNYIGGSDISAVMCMNRWKTPLKLWLEKTGESEPDDLSKVEAVQLGTELEEFVAQKFSRETGKQVRKQSKMYVHKDYPFMVAHIDRLITGTDELLECKTCGSYKEDEWAEVETIIEENGEKKIVTTEKIPQEYVLQVMWYLGITGKKVGHIAVLIGGQKFKKRTIEFDSELFDVMVQMAKDFWECVKTKTMPTVSPTDNNLLLELFPEHSEDFIENSDEDEKIEKLQKIKSSIKVLEEEKDLLESEIKSSINTHIGLKTPNYIVTWKSYSQTYVDTQKLKDAGLYATYAYQKPQRKLLVNKNKKAA